MKKKKQITCVYAAQKGCKVRFILFSFTFVKVGIVSKQYRLIIK